MATWDDVHKAALSLPETIETVAGDGRRAWSVRNKKIAWERPLRPADRAALGADTPAGPVLAFRTVDLLEKEEILAAMPDVFFTTPHFDGYPAVLAQLDRLEVPVLAQLMLDAWRHRAPKRLVRELDRG
jgi:hypothetical protein